jgi:hypothetical protein
MILEVDFVLAGKNFTLTVMKLLCFFFFCREEFHFDDHSEFLAPADGDVQQGDQSDGGRAPGTALQNK